MPFKTKKLCGGWKKVTNEVKPPIYRYAYLHAHTHTHVLCKYDHTAHIYNKYNRLSLAVVFANGPGDRGSIPGGVIPKTQKMVLDAPLLNTQHYKVGIKGKVEQSRERSSTLSYTSV